MRGLMIAHDVLASSSVPGKLLLCQINTYSKYRYLFTLAVDFTFIFLALPPFFLHGVVLFV